MEKKNLKIVLFISLALSIFMFIGASYSSFQHARIAYFTKAQPDKFIIDTITEYRGDFNEERSYSEYYINGFILSTKDKRTVMFRELQTYNSALAVPSKGDTLSIWYSPDWPEDVLVLKIDSHFPFKEFEKRLVVTVSAMVFFFLLTIFLILKIKSFKKLSA